MGLDRACLKAWAAARAVQVTASSRGSNQRGSGTYTPHLAQNQTPAPWQGELGCCPGLCRGLGGHTQPANAPQPGAGDLEATEGNCWQLVVPSCSLAPESARSAKMYLGKSSPKDRKSDSVSLHAIGYQNSCFSSHRETCFSWFQN